jgi:hypothetical protein
MALFPASTLVIRCITELHNRFGFANDPHEGLATNVELEITWAMLRKISGQI